MGSQEVLQSVHKGELIKKNVEIRKCYHSLSTHFLYMYFGLIYTF